MLQRIILVLIISLLVTNINAQQTYYKEAFTGINTMLFDNSPLDFQKAVFLTENAYYEGELDEKKFKDNIQLYTSICKSLMTNGSLEYTERDKEVAMAQCAVFLFMTDTVRISVGTDIVGSIPFSYNYEDYAGQKEWSNMFVSTLFDTNKGNCHSLPYLYKMIMDKLGQECHLALAPNHIYIKAQNKKVGWYNIELTCSDFPTDAWLMASGYIHIDAIRNKVYMKALTDKEAVAMTLLDLAQGYQAKCGIGDGSFIIKCCDTALEHFPNYINAMLLKGEILTALYKQTPDNSRMEEMNTLYATIHQLGYRKMPSKMYQNWLGSLSADKSDQRMRSVVIKR
ncbi:hypothetical protein CLV62_104137 [Dysgonomonas alginatilytica]|uniref:Transglutaminase superfamily protein n=1 Tax=Dysgonomonas alginatilytica TaxID=1605892 RepID=A0A2V3PRQ1_9BACT|nr:hypothetical protein [Dysgonomonas alginatilytica]PXV66876.1 hypothetical protein CLV62_104137 [Dysgonomonas alginatilytica]